jgi:hypothetical protein
LRVLIFKVIKHHCRNMTTTVVMRDLSQVEDGAFLYVLKHGRPVDRDFRHHLEADLFLTFTLPDEELAHDKTLTNTTRDTAIKIMRDNFLVTVPDKEMRDAVLVVPQVIVCRIS